MKIDPILNTNMIRTYKAGKMTPAAAGIQSGRDEVIFSNEALNFSKVIAEVEYRSKEERAHIANVTNAVRQGEYSIESGKIADKILESVLRR